MAEELVRERKDKDGGVSLRLRVSPGARKTAITGRYGESALKVKVAAPPVGGKANSELERFLAEILAVPRSQVAVTVGRAGRDKVVIVRGVTATQVRTRLAG